MSSVLDVGEQAFLRLDGFDPSWRQSLVVVSHRKRNKSVCIVRVLDQEISGIHDQVTFFELGGSKYILVEGRPEQLRGTCSQPHRALEQKRDRLLARCQEVLEQDSLLYLTASEDAEDFAPKTKTKTKELDSSSEDSSDQDLSDEEDAVLRLLGKASKSRQDTGIAKGSKERSAPKERFPLLKGEKDKEAEAVDLDKLLAQALSTSNPASSSTGLNTLISLELLKAIKGKSKTKRTHMLAREDEDTPSSSDDDQDDIKLTGAGKALRNYRHGHKMMRKRPLRHVRRYIEEIESVMGVSPEVPYRISDYTKRINWNKQKSLMRVHFAVSELLKSILKGKSNLAALQAVQLLRACHQSSLDQGSWKAASLLLGHQDPLERPRFGWENRISSKR